MGRPLDWLVVGISLLVFFANRMLADPALPGQGAVAPARVQAESPFAYVREDGTEIPVPAMGPGAASDAVIPVSFEQLHAESGFQAVFTWSLPISASRASP